MPPAADAANFVLSPQLPRSALPSQSAAMMLLDNQTCGHRSMAAAAQ